MGGATGLLNTAEILIGASLQQALGVHRRPARCPPGRPPPCCCNRPAAVPRPGGLHGPARDPGRAWRDGPCPPWSAEASLPGWRCHGRKKQRDRRPDLVAADDPGPGRGWRACLTPLQSRWRTATLLLLLAASIYIPIHWPYPFVSSSALLVLAARSRALRADRAGRGPSAPRPWARDADPGAIPLAAGRLGLWRGLVLLPHEPVLPASPGAGLRPGAQRGAARTAARARGALPLAVRGGPL